MTGKWIRWNGREMPVAAKVAVFIKLESDRGDEGLCQRPRPAGNYNWTAQSGIIAYMVGHPDSVLL
jgi:hypothetical protein